LLHVVKGKDRFNGNGCGRTLPMAPTAATPYKDTAVAKLAPALVTYCKVTGGSVLATPPSIARGAVTRGALAPFTYLKRKSQFKWPILIQLFFWRVPLYER
jgi:hypothetical protein